VSDPDTPGGVTAIAPPPGTRPPKVRTRPGTSMLDPAILRRAVVEALVKLDPRNMVRNPVMFVVEIGSVVTSVQFRGATHCVRRIGRDLVVGDGTLRQLRRGGRRRQGVDDFLAEATPEEKMSFRWMTPSIRGLHAGGRDGSLHRHCARRGQPRR
jgi:hypothetical protein